MSSLNLSRSEPTTRINGRNHHCHSCARSFKRPEHLKRHEASHDHRLKFVCKECGKAFSRSDTLARHCATHEAPSVDGPLPTAVGRQRACIECAKAREKCTRGQPCRRCSLRLLTCQYPESSSGRLGCYMSSGTQQMHQDLSETSEVRETMATYEDANAVIAYDAGVRCNTDDANVRPAEATSSITPIHTNQMASEASQHEAIDQYNPLLDFDFPLNWLPIDLDTDYDALGPLTSDNISNNVIEYAMDASQIGFQHSTVQEFSALTGPSPNTSEQSQSVRSVDVTSPGTFYATSSDGARLSSSKRAKLRHNTRHFPGTTQMSGRTEFPNMSNNGTELQFPHVEHIVLDDALLPATPASISVSQECFRLISETFRETCLQPVQSMFQPYLSYHFPTRQQFSYFAQLYFERFSPALPIVHPNFVKTESIDLILAIAAVGCQYSGVVEFFQCSAPLHEFLRRRLKIEIERNHDVMMPHESITALFLNQVGMTFGLSPKMATLAEARHGLLLHQCRAGRLLRETESLSDPSTAESHWKNWVSTEGRRRLGYAVFLFYSMLALYDMYPQPITTSEIDAKLPNDNLWHLKTESEWTKEIRESRNKIPSLPQAVNTLFRTKQVVLKDSHFAQVLLIHGVYNEIRQVRDYISRPLSTFFPSAELEKSDCSERPAEWIVSDSTFSSWRNAACDCIDALHWVANAEIARLSGIEPPTVFHLHFARTALLTPYQAIRRVATTTAGIPSGPDLNSASVTSQKAGSALREVLNWIQRDEHKARLAMIHAGCLLWHVRRFSAQGFYESSSMYLTILTIWAYSTHIHRAAYKPQVSDVTVPSEIEGQDRRGCTPSMSSARHSGPAQGSLSVDEIDIGDQPSLIRLDRPNDDEMVQLFVRKGRPNLMKAHITGVGDICAKTAPLRIIREGLRLLRSAEGAASCWNRVHWNYCNVLEGLEHALSQQANG
ncbi:hypothetical protein K431DRAFT_124910 [Polychaeton citri CBS 116435]|uniref:C2H2 type zinc finger domain protein n=1 Tax=Polychaeton citri CBS 116435 TaxID=1314669 RepID=A0A9P4Q3U0_9PEZI|nr:hypothetical protein K431DRAFT_124910 [Polychaeton citri CBS 116435]